MDLDRQVKYTAFLTCFSWIFLGSNGIMLGGVGGLMCFIGLCCINFDRKRLASFWLVCAAAMHFAAFVLGITAIVFYLNHPSGSEWGFSLLGDTVQGSWWWIALSVVLSLVNLAAAVLDMLMVRRAACRPIAQAEEHPMTEEPLTGGQGDVRNVT